MTVTRSKSYSAMNCVTASSSCCSDGSLRPSVAMLDPSTTACPLGMEASQPCRYAAPVIRAVLFDFGGVILSSPFEAFNRYEAEVGLPLDTIRRINATNPDDNAGRTSSGANTPPPDSSRRSKARPARSGSRSTARE